MNRPLFILISVCAVTLFLSSESYAARAVVGPDGAPFYARPDSSSEILDELPPGASLAVSRGKRRGFRRAKLPSGQKGWVRASDVRLQSKQKRRTRKKKPRPREEEYQEYSSSPSYKRFAIWAHGGLHWFSLSDITTQVNSQSIKNGFYFGGEFHYSLSPHFFLGLRGDLLTKSVAATATSTGTSFDLEVSSTPIALGAGYYLLQMPSSLFVAISGFAGLAPNTRFSLSTTGYSIQYSGTAWTALAKLSGGVDFIENFGIFAEAGYRLLSTGEVDGAVSGTGFSLATQATVDMSGLFLGGGLRVRF